MGSEAAFFVGVWGKAAYTLHATPAQIAMVMFSLAIAGMLGSTVGGVLVDRYGPRKVIAFGEAAFVPAALAIILADSIPKLVAITFVWAFVGAPVATAGSSFAPFLASGEGDLERVNAWIEGAGSAAFITGTALGATVAHYASVDWVFVIDAVTSLFGAVLIWRVAVAVPPRAEGDRHPFAELREGVRTAYSLRSVRYYVLAGTLTWLGFGAFGALEPLFYRDVVHAGVEAIGWMNTIFGTGMVMGSWLLTRLSRRMISARGLAACVTLTGLGGILYIAVPDLRFIACGSFVWGAIIGVLEPLLRTLVHRDTPEGMVGRIIGTAEVHRRAGELLPLAIAPTLAATLGVHRTLILNGVVTATIAAASYGEARAIDREGRPPKAVRIERLRADDEPVSPLR